MKNWKSTACLLLMLVAPTALADFDWDTALNGKHRAEGNAERNQYRHPRETLEFFGIEPGMTVMEVTPGGGWYTEVLAPLMKGNGKLIAAHYDANGGSYSRRALGGFLTKLGKDDDVYGEVDVTALQPPKAMAAAEPESVDLVVAFRNVHSWLRMKQAETFFSVMYDALKPGGALGIVQHRGKPDFDMDTMVKTAYITEEKVIELAELAGFELEAKSEINANPADTKDYPGGVWTLPPSFREGEKNRDKYLAIGESDRMTLRFRKPAE
jgi:predicted methyltransferase